MNRPSAGEHYFSASPTSAAGDREVMFTVDGTEHTLRSAHGVFSSTRLDPGTRLLLRRAPRPPVDGTLLDLGCGYGPIACVQAWRCPAATVWAVDSNERALELTRQNATAWGLRNVHVGAQAASARFDAIYSNPPIRIGKPALHELLGTWLARLTDTGSAYLVVQRNLGADSLQRWLVEHGHRCVRVAGAKGYRVLEVGRAAAV